MVAFIFAYYVRSVALRISWICKHGLMATAQRLQKEGRSLRDAAVELKVSVANLYLRQARVWPSSSSTCTWEQERRLLLRVQVAMPHARAPEGLRAQLLLPQAHQGLHGALGWE